MPERDSPDIDRVRDELAGERSSSALTRHEDVSAERVRESVERLDPGAPEDQERGPAAPGRIPNTPPGDEEAADDRTETVGEASTGGVDVAGDSEPHNPVSPA